MPSAATVWKYDLPITDDLSVKMPTGARVLSVGWQGIPGVIQLWALVNPDAALEVRSFHIAGTGHPIPDGLRFIGTVLYEGGALIWHVFEPTPTEGSPDA